MFEALNAQPADSLLGLIKMFNADGRAGKIDLGVGVYRDATGVTPVFKAVKEAEKILLKSQDSKKYLGPEGDAGFTERLQPYVIGASERIAGRIAALQTPGGTGALRLGAELIRKANPRAAVQLGAPTWPNHAPIFAAAELEIETSRFADLKAQTIAVDGVWETLDRAKEGDVVLLHGCCHNPTGMDFSRDLWKAIVEVLVARRLTPFIDLAYQGLGDGLEEDAWATRLVLDSVEEALVAYSCDKNFGLYRDRVGALFVLSRDSAETATVMSNLAALARVNWSMPPDHGAAAVRIILERPKLVQMWREELELDAHPHQRQSPGAGRGRPGARLHPRPARPVLESRHVEVAGDGAARAPRHLLHRLRPDQSGGHAAGRRGRDRGGARGRRLPHGAGGSGLRRPGASGRRGGALEMAAQRADLAGQADEVGFGEPHRLGDAADDVAGFPPHRPALVGQGDDHPALVRGRPAARHEAHRLEALEQRRHRVGVEGETLAEPADGYAVLAPQRRHRQILRISQAEAFERAPIDPVEGVAGGIDGEAEEGVEIDIERKRRGVGHERDINRARLSRKRLTRG